MAATQTLLLPDDDSAESMDDYWRFSTLNRNGYPVEFTFSTLDRGVRYTIELGGPTIPPTQRLALVGPILTQLGVTAPLTGTLNSFRQAQGSGALRWGAWLGVRHLPEGDRYKLYAEIGEGESDYARELLQQIIGPEPLLPDHSVRLVALGRELGTARTEFYFMIDRRGLAYWEIGYLLRRFKLQDRQQELIALMEEARGYTLNSPRPPFAGTEYGFSLAVMETGAPLVFSLFVVADPFIGYDARIRRQLLSLCEHRGWDLGAYRALTEPLAGWTTRSEHHNVVAFITGPGDLLGMHISLSPPS